MAAMQDSSRESAHSTPWTVGLVPASRLAGLVAVPSSKSVAQRRLLLAAAAHGVTRLTALPRGGDVEAARAFVAATGARFTPIQRAAAEIEGLPPGPHRGWAGTRAFQVGESGTLARLGTTMLALAGHAGARQRVEASGTLLARGSAPLFAALREAGVELHHEGAAGGWPVALRSIGPPSELWLEHPVSSQEVSALLCALAAWPGEFLLRVAGDIPSRPYVALTLRELARFGAVVEPHGAQWLVRGPLRAPAEPLVTECDASAAAVALAAGAIGGLETRTELRADSSQGDARCVELLGAFGAEARFDARGSACGARTLRGAQLDLSDVPDLAPVLAAVAIAAALRGGGASRLDGLATLNRKESRRLDLLAEYARSFGCRAEVRRDDVLEIAPGSSVPEGVVLDAHGDHRLAFAGALLGLAVPGVLVRGAESVSKSWPGFWADMAAAGGILAGPQAALASTRRAP